MAYYGAYPSAYPAATFPSGYASSTYNRSIGPQSSYVTPSLYPQQSFGQFGQPQPYGGFAGGYGGFGANQFRQPVQQPQQQQQQSSQQVTQKVQREVSERAAAWTAKNQWDFDELPHTDGFRFYMSSVMLCASSDGVLDPKEKAWVLGYAAALGSPADLMKELESMSVDSLKKQNLGEDFEKFCARSDKRSTASKRGIIYDAIRAASADGVFAIAERKSVVDLAIKFGLSESVVSELEGLVNDEKALKEKKANLVHRYGTK